MTPAEAVFLKDHQLKESHGWTIKDVRHTANETVQAIIFRLIAAGLE